MKGKIFSKQNTDVLRQSIKNAVFICVQGVDESCAIISSVDDITADVLEKMKSLVVPEILKVVCNQSDYDILKPGLSLVFDNVKYVNREGEYEIHFQPKPSIIRASKTIVKEEVVEEVQKNVKVIIVDDSKTICNLLTKIMDLSPHIEVVATINDPLLAEEAIKKHNPDVITLDIHMPNMNGVELLQKIQPKYKVPAIMISSISMQEGPLVLDALESGAVDYIQKPDMSNFATVANEINTKILAASKAVNQSEHVNMKVVSSTVGINLEENLIVIGASTGGTKALKEVLDGLPNKIPPILIVQHIPAEFSRAFADRLNETAKFTVKEAVDGDLVVSNQVLIAPGGKQMKFVMKGASMKIEINDDPPVNRFKPSVDYLFDSVAKSKYDRNVVSAIFTGMGRDGADGMRRLKNAKNCVTIAQDEKTSVVFGMPKEAIKAGCVDHIVPLSEAASILMKACEPESQKKAQ